MLGWIKKYITKKYKLNTGDLVKDIGDSFAAVEDPGIVIQVFEDRYDYRHPLFLGLVKVKIDGIMVRWLDKKGSSHMYPACCVVKLELPEEKAKQLRTSAEERFEKPKPIPVMGKDTQQMDIPFDIEWDIPEMELSKEKEEERDPALNKMQEKLREVQRIVEERKKKGEGEE